MFSWAYIGHMITIKNFIQSLLFLKFKGQETYRFDQNNNDFCMEENFLNKIDTSRHLSLR